MTVRDLTILGCSSQQPTRQRNQGGYLLRWNNEGFLFDPGEGTQRQFIFANVAPTCVTRIFVSHFHGDHCLGLGSMLMRLNLDKVSHTIHCYYPASGKKYFDRLRYGTIYHETIKVLEHPVYENGIIDSWDGFKVEARFLDHGVENVGWRITESDQRKIVKEKISHLSVEQIQTLLKEHQVVVNQELIRLEDVSYVRKGDVFASVIDTRPCKNAYELAANATMLLCESTYTSEHQQLAYDHHHMTSKQAAQLAKQANVETLVLTHYSARYQNLDCFKQDACPIFPNTVLADDLKIIPFTKRKA